MRERLTTKQVALMSVFSALIVLVTRLPGIPVIGAPGAKVQLSAVLYPLIGILLGGRIGAVAVLIGNFVSWLIPPSTLLGFLMIPPGPISALVAGSLSSRKKVFNWRLASFVLLILNGLWYVTPLGMEALLYPVLHWLAFMLAISFGRRIQSFLISSSKAHVMAGMAMCSFAGLMTDSMAGNLIFICAVGWVVPLADVLGAVAGLGMFWLRLGIPKMPFTGLAALFMGALMITGVERVVMTVVSTLLGSAVLRLLGNDRLLTDR